MRVSKLLVFFLLCIQWSWLQASDTKTTFDLKHACALGFVQGFTEFLPVSSTGHMILLNDVFFRPPSTMSKVEQSRNASLLNHYVVCVQLGTILTLLLFYRREVWSIIKGVCGHDGAGLCLGLNVCLAFIPVGLAGFFLGDWIQLYLYNRISVISAIFVGGLVIFWIEFHRARARIRCDLSSMPIKVALGIGLLQMLALWPGLSRSLVTIAGGVLCGLSLVQAIHVSFLLGLLTSTVATSYQCLKHGAEMLQTMEFLPICAGIIVAFVVGMATIRLFFSYLKHRGLRLFAYYRVILALVFTFLTK